MSAGDSTDPKASASQGGDSAPTIVLVRPQEEGNVGAVARAMANFGLTRLVLVEPATPLRAVARAFAVHAGDVIVNLAGRPRTRRSEAIAAPCPITP